VYAGYGKILHGGIQSGVFDETMGWTAYHLTGLVAITASLQVEFLKPLFVEQKIEVRCRMESSSHSKVVLSAEIRDESGIICSKASGTFAVMEPDRFKRIMGEE
jgi:acyl-coenzyme A thioesterase PaaI-like protein